MLRPTVVTALVLASVAALLALATTAVGSPPQATIVLCGPDVPLTGTVCGTVAVPLDRSQPSAGTIPIYFELYRHTDVSEPSAGTVVVSIGGPGVSNAAVRGVWLSEFGPLLDQRDLLLIDHRGMGQSAAIDCQALQHVIGDQVAAARACGAQLGAASDRYGSADVADDVDAVRAALGIDKIDYYGDSYGAVDVRAYAARYPQHLRSAVLDSPVPSLDETFLRTLPGTMARITALVCQRSPRCAAANPDPAGTLAWLVQRVRRQPVIGTGYDADGQPHALVVDEQGLLGILYNDYFSDPAFLNHGELSAAAEALGEGDAVPLLRLAAESPLPRDFGDPGGFSSVGSTYAVYCSDARPAWDKNAPEATRQAQYQAALAALPAGTTSPFSPTAWAGFMAKQPVLIVPAADACVPWPTPARPEPPFAVDQPFPANVPALLLGGGLDYLGIPYERQLLPLFPPGTPFVDIASSGHATSAWSPCANAIVRHFIQTLRTGDTSCAADPLGSMHNPFGSATGRVQLQGIGSFPRVVAQATPALPVGADDSSPFDRQVVAVAWSAVEDAFYRTPRMLGTTGRGLRGGSYTVNHGATTTALDYEGAHFTNDVGVSGHATLDLTTSTLDAHVDVAGPGNHDGTLDFRGVLWDPTQPTVRVTGVIGGRRVTLAVLAN